MREHSAVLNLASAVSLRRRPSDADAPLQAAGERVAVPACARNGLLRPAVGVFAFAQALFAVEQRLSAGGLVNSPLVVASVRLFLACAQAAFAVEERLSAGGVVDSPLVVASVRLFLACAQAAFAVV
jgi:hypothetical protein